MSSRNSHWKIGLLAAAAFAASFVLRGSAASPRAQLSSDLLATLAQGPGARARVIVHGTDAEIDRLAQRHGLHVVRRLEDGAVVVADRDQLSRLAIELGGEAHLSGDVVVRPSMLVSTQASAADQTWNGGSALLGLGGIPGVNGQGIVVAVVDSGVATHTALKDKVVANVSFVTGDASTDDAFGHGTHVAGIIAGLTTAATKVTPLYTGGIAPGAKLVNVRVLGADGSGYTSDVIAGIDWVIANRSRFNIRVVNLSLGHSVNEPSATDPLCEAVARAVNAGLVVVAAAGNMGMSPSGQMVLGSILSPGNSPYAITVGSVNTKGTASRSDDTLAAYSSRGPTAYDFQVKPDVAAPGNRIVSLEAKGSYLATTYPTLHRAGSGFNAYMQLSGTSMATPMVSGGVALLLQGTPGMVPAQVKLALQTGATYMPDAGLIGAGAGEVNFWASRQIAANGLNATLTTTVIAGVKTTSSGMAYWDSGSLAHRVYDRTGLRLLSAADALLVWLNPSLLRFGDLNLLGLTNPLAALAGGNRLVWGEVATWTGSQDEILWGTRIYSQSGDEILWGTSRGDEILWGTSTLTAQDPR